MTELVPTHGVRVLLELISADELEVVYRVELHGPASSFAGRATIVIASGALTWGEWATLRGEGAPDAWMIESARAFLRTLHKNHATERDWPRKQLRWRDRRV